MKTFVWISTGLMLIGLLSFSSISLAEEGKWTKKADMPTARLHLSTSVVNGKIYAIGGQPFVGGGDVPHLSTVEEYDPVTDKWTKKADMPTARAGLSTSVVSGKIYAIGGRKGSSTMEEYNPVTNKWTKKTDIPIARVWLSTSAVNGKIYAIGGFGGGPLAIVEEYDPATDKWTKKADMPTARGGLSASVINGKIYAIGGAKQDLGPFLSAVEEYDPMTDEWTKKADMPTARYIFSTGVANGKIYAIGGAGLPNALSTVDKYDPMKDEWTKKAGMPTARFGFSSGVVNGKIYAIGGSNLALVGNPSLSTVEAYDPGFAGEGEEGQGIEAEGKLATTWGKMKK